MCGVQVQAHYARTYDRQITAFDDMFVVKYAADQQRELLGHVDAGNLSFMVPLSTGNRRGTQLPPVPTPQHFKLAQSKLHSHPTTNHAYSYRASSNPRSSVDNNPDPRSSSNLAKDAESRVSEFDGGGTYFQELDQILYVSLFAASNI